MVLEMPKDQADAFGEVARKNIEENFSNDKMCRLTLEVYRSLLSQTV